MRLNVLLAQVQRRSDEVSDTKVVSLVTRLVRRVSVTNSCTSDLAIRRHGGDLLTVYSGRDEPFRVNTYRGYGATYPAGVPLYNYTYEIPVRADLHLRRSCQLVIRF